MSLRTPSALLAIAGLLLIPHPAAVGKPADDKPTTQLRIEVTAGDERKPLADASVYVKYPENPKDRNGKLFELNLKTNQQGVARTPAIPQGDVLIQIIASGWKTYGQWHQITRQEQVVSIHLVRPTTRWY